MNRFKILTPAWTLFYRGINITADISAMVISITYVDRLRDYSGECELVFEDQNKLWQGPWYPGTGNEVSLTLGYEGDPPLSCGEFQIDEVVSSGPPDQIVLRCIAAWITPAMRTRKSVAYEGVTLPEVAPMVASQYGYSVSSAASVLNVQFERITQRHESDLEFLKRIGQSHGYNFTVRGNQFVFYASSVLESVTSAIPTSGSGIREFTFTNRSVRTYQGSRVSYQSPGDKRLVTEEAVAPGRVVVGDRLRHVTRCETDVQAALKAQAELARHNRYKGTVRLAMEGRPNLVAGNSISLAGFGQNSGVYLIEEARHRVERTTGYTTEVTAYRIVDEA